MATHSGILAWEISWTEKLVGYSTWGHKKVRWNLTTKRQQQYRETGTVRGPYSKFELHDSQGLLLFNL